MDSQSSEPLPAPSWHNISHDVLLYMFEMLPMVPYWYNLQKLSRHFRDGFQHALHHTDTLDFINARIHQNIFVYKSDTIGVESQVSSGAAPQATRTRALAFHSRGGAVPTQTKDREQKARKIVFLQLLRAIKEHAGTKQVDKSQSEILNVTSAGTEDGPATLYNNLYLEFPWFRANNWSVDLDRIPFENERITTLRLPALILRDATQLSALFRMLPKLKSITFSFSDIGKLDVLFQGISVKASSLTSIVIVRASQKPQYGGSRFDDEISHTGCINIARSVLQKQALLPAVEKLVFKRKQSHFRPYSKSKGRKETSQLQERLSKIIEQHAKHFEQDLLSVRKWRTALLNSESSDKFVNMFKQFSASGKYSEILLDRQAVMATSTRLEKYLALAKRDFGKPADCSIKFETIEMVRKILEKHHASWIMELETWKDIGAFNSEFCLLEPAIFAFLSILADCLVPSISFVRDQFTYASVKDRWRISTDDAQYLSDNFGLLPSTRFFLYFEPKPQKICVSSHLLAEDLENLISMFTKTGV